MSSRRGPRMARRSSCCMASPSPGSAGGGKSALWPKPAIGSSPPTARLQHERQTAAHRRLRARRSGGRRPRAHRSHRVRRATLVGHDWGGIVAWWVALRHPDRVQRLVVLNAPTRSPSAATCSDTLRSSGEAGTLLLPAPAAARGQLPPRKLARPGPDPAHDQPPRDVLRG